MCSCICVTMSTSYHLSEMCMYIEGSKGSLSGKRNGWITVNVELQSDWKGKEKSKGFQRFTLLLVVVLIRFIYIWLIWVHFRILRCNLFTYLCIHLFYIFNWSQLFLLLLCIFSNDTLRANKFSWYKVMKYHNQSLVNYIHFKK